MATCPECDAPIEFDETDVDAGDILSCDECGTALVVSSILPLELDLAEDVDEDDDDEDEDDEDDEDEKDDETTDDYD